MPDLTFITNNDIPVEITNKMLAYEDFVNKTSKYKLGQKVRITDNYSALYKQMKVGVTDYDAKRDTKDCLGQVGTIIGAHKLQDVKNTCYMVEVNDLMYPLSEDLLSEV